MVLASKSRLQDGQKREIRLSYFVYMATLSKMVKFLVFELLILSNFAFIGHRPPRSLEAGTGPAFFAKNYTLVIPVCQAPIEMDNE